MITTDELKVQLADYGTAVKDLEEALAIARQAEGLERYEALLLDELAGFKRLMQAQSLGWDTLSQQLTTEGS